MAVLLLLGLAGIVGARLYARRKHGAAQTWRRAGEFEPMEYEMGRVGSGGGTQPLQLASRVDRQALNPVREGVGSEYRGFADPA